MDTDGSTPLHEAARNGHLEICEMIADKFVDKNPKDQKGRTPYHEAAQWGRVPVCAWLYHGKYYAHFFNSYEVYIF